MHSNLTKALAELELTYLQELELKKNELIKNFNPEILKEKLNQVIDLEKKNQEIEFADEISKIQIDADATIQRYRKWADDEVINRDRKINNLLNKKTKTEFLELVNQLKRHDGTYIYYVERGCLFTGEKSFKRRILSHVAPRIDNGCIKFICVDDVIDHIQKYRI